jgi:hypothetical protein
MIDTGDKSKNKEAYDRLFKAKGEIEAELGRALQWDRLDDHQRSRIFVARRGAINMAKEELEELKSWALDNLLDIVDVFQPRIRRL